MLEAIPYYRVGEALPNPIIKLLGAAPVLRPVIPDPGTRFQLVHEEDVAKAFLAGVRGMGEPGPYNLAARGTLTMADVAAALGWYSVPVPAWRSTPWRSSSPGCPRFRTPWRGSTRCESRC